MNGMVARPARLEAAGTPPRAVPVVVPPGDSAGGDEADRIVVERRGGGAAGQRKGVTRGPAAATVLTGRRHDVSLFPAFYGP
jgi:hypothetical protein